MGIIADAFERMKAYTQDRQQPTYSPPPSRASDGSSVNTDSSVENARSLVAVGPARTRPTSGTAEGTTPTPHETTRLQTVVDRRRGNSYPKVGSESATNVHADRGRDLPYGIQDSPARADMDTIASVRGDK